MWLAAEVEREREGSLVWGREKMKRLCGNGGCERSLGSDGGGGMVLRVKALA